MWQLVEAIRGLGDAARAFDVPVVSGNVSLYNETKGKGILPTPQIAMVGLIEDASKSVTIDFKNPGDRIFVLNAADDKDLGGSEYMATFAGVEKGAPPVLNYDLEILTGQVIRQLIDERLLRSCHDISSGGLAVALAECCFGPVSNVGAILKVEQHHGRRDSLLFAESGARYIVSCAPEDQEAVRQHIEKAGLVVSLSGTVGGDTLTIDGAASIAIEGAFGQWSRGLEEKVFSESKS
jgi:phosphoribosylformylglycinamidine synthase subunit PurL